MVTSCQISLSSYRHPQDEPSSVQWSICIYKQVRHCVNRNPPVGVRRVLRQAVGFGCPIPNCGSPYLVYHHFDPPWHEQQHMNPEGIIPLCAQHHAWANQKTWTTSQLREFKQSASHRRTSVRG